MAKVTLAGTSPLYGHGEPCSGWGCRVEGGLREVPTAPVSLLVCDLE